MLCSESEGAAGTSREETVSIGAQHREETLPGSSKTMSLTLTIEIDAEEAFKLQRIAAEEGFADGGAYLWHLFRRDIRKQVGRDSKPVRGAP